MGDYITKIRTNFFRVTDSEKLRSLVTVCMAEDEIVVITEDGEGEIKYGFVCNGAIYGLPENFENSGEQDMEDDEGCTDLFYSELQKILPDDEAIIITTIAFDKLRSLVGCCTIITSNNIEHIEIGAEAEKQALEMLGNQTRNEAETTIYNNNVKFLNLVIQCLEDPIHFIESFEIRADIHEPEKALRAAVNEFIISGSDEAKQVLEHSNYCFNWADAMNSVPESLFIKHGLTPIKRQTIDIFVEHNEILAQPLESDVIKNIVNEHLIAGKREIAIRSNYKNLFAEETAEAITKRNEKLIALLTMADINQQTITGLMEAEDDNELIKIYEYIIDALQS